MRAVWKRNVLVAAVVALAATLLSGCLGPDAARRGVLFGTYIDYWGNNTGNPGFDRTLNQFSMIEYFSDWAFVEPQYQQYDFSGPDRWFNYIANRHATVKSSALIWAHENPNGNPQHIPDYLKSLSAADLRAELKTHIQKFVQRYPQVKVWTVVNEPFTQDSSGNWVPYDNVFEKKLGPGWMREALVDAYQANPNATYVALNEFDADGYTDHSTRMFSYYKNQLVGAIPPDHLAVGFEMHLDTCPDNGWDNPSSSDLRRNLQRFSDLGIQVHITEMDFGVRCVDGTLAHKFDVQKQKYHDVVATCLAVANCKAISTWGIGDADSWIRTGLGKMDWPLLFDDNYNPKPDYDGVEDALNGR